MLELIRQPWSWFLSGPVIAMIMVVGGMMVGFGNLYLRYLKKALASLI